MATHAGPRSRGRHAPRLGDCLDIAIAKLKVRIARLHVHAATMRNAAQEFAPVDSGRDLRLELPAWPLELPAQDSPR
jgi:hypothetical protein